MADSSDRSILMVCPVYDDYIIPRDPQHEQMQKKLLYPLLSHFCQKD